MLQKKNVIFEIFIDSKYQEQILAYLTCLPVRNGVKAVQNLAGWRHLLLYRRRGRERIKFEYLEKFIDLKLLIPLYWYKKRNYDLISVLNYLNGCRLS